jgi:hypothetical protein
MKKKVYVAAPYTIGDVGINVRWAIEAGDALLMRGFIPFIPHLSHFWHLLTPHDYETWLAFDLEWLSTCDAVFRVAGESAGADREVEKAKRYGILVFTSLEALQKAREKGEF